jgi:hypothetical protein
LSDLHLKDCDDIKTVAVHRIADSFLLVFEAAAPQQRKQINPMGEKLSIAQGNAGSPGTVTGQFGVPAPKSLPVSIFALCGLKMQEECHVQSR